VAIKRGEVRTQAGRFEEAEQALIRAREILGLQDPMPPVMMARLWVATGDPENFEKARILWRAGLERGHVPGAKDREVLKAFDL